jgi:hypothetical protein
MAITCDPAALASASACYCYDKRTANAVLIYLLAQIAGNTMAPDALARAARCYCIGDAKSRDAVLFYLLCQAANAGGETTTCTFLEGAIDPTGVTTPTFIGQLYHDTTADTYYRATGLTSADWTAIGGAACVALSGAVDPTGVTTPDFVGQLYHDTVADSYYRSTGLTNADWTAIGVSGVPPATLLVVTAEKIDIQVDDTDTLFSFPALTAITDTTLTISGCSDLVTVDAPLLASVAGDVSFGINLALTTINLPSLITCGGFTANGCTMLTTINVPVWVPTDGTTVNFSGCALTATSVELILRRLVLAGVLTCTIDLSGGTNAGTASLSAQGQADVTTLGAQLTINP